MTIEADDTDAIGPQLVTAVAFALIALAGATDLILDRQEHRGSTLHLGVELAITGLSLVLAVRIWFHWRALVGSLRRAEQSLLTRQQERDEWRAKAELALEGMRTAMEEQFSRWELTPAEREVAVLVLQGKGHKQIAAETHRSERTVRQHAVAVYEKSHLGGRAELAAFFLEGLMAPRP